MTAFVHVWFADVDVNLLAFAGTGVVVFLVFELVQTIRKRRARNRRRRKHPQMGLGMVPEEGFEPPTKGL